MADTTSTPQGPIVTLTAVESANHAELAAAAVLLGPAPRFGTGPREFRYRFSPLANADTFGTLVKTGTSPEHAAVLAILALRSGAAFWKR